MKRLISIALIAAMCLVGLAGCGESPTKPTDVPAENATNTTITTSEAKNTNTPIPTAEPSKGATETSTPAPIVTPEPATTNTPVPTVAATPEPTEAPDANNESGLTVEELNISLGHVFELSSSNGEDKVHETFIAVYNANKIDEVLVFEPEMPAYVLYTADGEDKIFIFYECFRLEWANENSTVPNCFDINYCSAIVNNKSYVIDVLDGSAFNESTVISLESLDNGVITDADGNAIIMLAWEFGTGYVAGEYVADGYEACVMFYESIRVRRNTNPDL